MASATHNLTVEQGATFSLRLEVQTPAGAAVDLSGWTARAQIRTSHKALKPTATFTTSMNAVSGYIYLSLTSVETAAIPFGEYVYDVELYSADATPLVQRMVMGTVTVSPETTR